MREAITTSNAPGAIGPYSQAIRVDSGKLLFCSGQIPLDPKTKEMVGTTAAEQCKQVMENISGLLAAGNADFSKVVKTTIFLADMNDFEAVNKVYAGYFTNEPPARSTVQAARLPRDARVEIEVIAVI